MFAPKWSVKAEYLYTSFEGADLLRRHCSWRPCVGTLNLNSVQVGVNYHF